MRCKACNDPLSNRESVRKSVITGEYIDLCDKCFDTIKEDVPTVDNPIVDDDRAVDEANETKEKELFDEIG